MTRHEPLTTEEAAGADAARAEIERGRHVRASDFWRPQTTETDAEARSSAEAALRRNVDARCDLLRERDRAQAEVDCINLELRRLTEEARSLAVVDGC